MNSATGGFGAGPRLPLSRLSRPVPLAEADARLHGAGFRRTGEYRE
ncbi:hypothetical protein AB0L04_32095 [Streptomyces glaucescens]